MVGRNKDFLEGQFCADGMYCVVKEGMPELDVEKLGQRASTAEQRKLLALMSISTQAQVSGLCL